MTTWYNATGKPEFAEFAYSSDMRDEFSLIESSFNKLPDFTSADYGSVLAVNSGGTAFELKTIAAVTAVIGGSAGAVDNAILRANGSGGATVQSSSVKIGDNGEIYGYIENQITLSSTSLTINDASVHPSGSVIRVITTTATTITIDINAMPTGWLCTIRQIGSGSVTVSNSTGTLSTRQANFRKLAGQYAVGGIAIDSSGVAVMFGDTAVV